MQLVGGTSCLGFMRIDMKYLTVLKIMQIYIDMPGLIFDGVTEIRHFPLIVDS